MGRKLMHHGEEYTSSFDSAANVKYSNDKSGLKSKFVQGAIDEINNNLNDLRNKNVFDICNNICMNLIPFPYSSGTRTENGITFTVNDDGTIVVNGTATADTYFNIDAITDGLNITEEGQTYTLSGCPTGGSETTYSVLLYEYESDKETVVQNNSDVGRGVSFLSKPHVYTSIVISIGSGTTVSNLAFKPMLEIGSVSHEYVQPISEPNSRINEVVASLNNDLTNSRKLLWSNPNKAVAFNPQTIEIQQTLNDFDEIEIVSTSTNTASTCCKTYCDKTLPNGRIEAMSYGNSFPNSGMFTRSVKVDWNANTITFENGISLSPSSNSTNNVVAIPVKIYGVKYYSR